MNEIVTPEPENLSLLTAREAAQYLRLSLSTLYRMEQNGQLAPLRTPGGHRRYTRKMLNACLDANPAEAKTSQQAQIHPSHPAPAPGSHD